MKRWIGIGVISIIIISLIFIVAPLTKKSNSGIKESDESIPLMLLEKVHSDVENYCTELDNKANSSSCPTCTMVSDLEKSFRFVNTFSDPINNECIPNLPNPYNSEQSDKEEARLDSIPECVSRHADNLYRYEITKEGYLLEVELTTIYGHNTRRGSTVLTFNFDKELNLISENIPELHCLD